MSSDLVYIQRCLELAANGLGNVAPNPMVGAVIVLNNKIIGEGYHQKCGEAHAEVNAVNSVLDQSLLSEATIYVSLEPCAHFGKTPPCADLIVKHRFKRVVIACTDTFSEVSGKGIQRIKEAGIEVTVGVLEKEARDLNKRFFTFHEKKRPYVILKWAQSKDGFIDIDRSEGETGIHWITQKDTKQLVHKWRSEEPAILVGKQTVLQDNPSLTVREWSGKNPIRIILDSNAEVSNGTLLEDDVPTYILNTVINKVEGNKKWVQLPNMEIKTILSVLYSLDIQSVIIEGGQHVLTSFIKSNSWDEARILTGTKDIRKGLLAPKVNGKVTSDFLFSEDKVTIYRNV